MNNKIIDYLTLEFARDESINFAVGRKLKEAFQLAKKKYNSMSEKEKEELLKKIKEK